MLVGFAATVTIGLALGSWYVGVRIVAANEGAPASRAVNAPAKASASQAAPTLQPPALAGLSIQAPAGPSVPAPTPVTPPPGLYLEVAGLGPLQGASFVKGLAAEGYRTRMRSATNQEDRRILIGPFEGRSALEKAERKLQSTGVLALEVTY
jgi:cell division septation protein DedD